jgi:hypothetical protein
VSGGGGGALVRCYGNGVGCFASLAASVIEIVDVVVIVVTVVVGSTDEQVRLITDAFQQLGAPSR